MQVTHLTLRHLECIVVFRPDYAEGGMDAWRGEVAWRLLQRRALVRQGRSEARRPVGVQAIDLAAKYDPKKKHASFNDAALAGLIHETHGSG